MQRSATVALVEAAEERAAVGADAGVQSPRAVTQRQRRNEAMVHHARQQSKRRFQAEQKQQAATTATTVEANQQAARRKSQQAGGGAERRRYDESNATRRNGTSACFCEEDAAVRYVEKKKNFLFEELRVKIKIARMLRPECTRSFA